MNRRIIFVRNNTWIQCQYARSLSREMSLSGALGPGGVSVQGVGVSVQGVGVSVQGVSVQEDLCQGDPPLGYMLAVRILLHVECILVQEYFLQCLVAYTLQKQLLNH